MGESDFHQFIRMRNQLVVAVRDFSKEENRPPVHLKLIPKRHGGATQTYTQSCEVVDLPHRKICITMLRYSVEKLETSYVQVRFFGTRKDGRKFNQIA